MCVQSSHWHRQIFRFCIVVINVRYHHSYQFTSRVVVFRVFWIALPPWHHLLTCLFIMAHIVNGWLRAVCRYFWICTLLIPHQISNDMKTQKTTENYTSHYMNDIWNINGSRWNCVEAEEYEDNMMHNNQERAAESWWKTLINLWLWAYLKRAISFSAVWAAPGCLQSPPSCRIEAYS